MVFFWAVEDTMLHHSKEALLVQINNLDISITGSGFFVLNRRCLASVRFLGSVKIGFVFNTMTGDYEFAGGRRMYWLHHNIHPMLSGRRQCPNSTIHIMGGCWMSKSALRVEYVSNLKSLYTQSYWFNPILLPLIPSLAQEQTQVRFSFWQHMTSTLTFDENVAEYVCDYAISQYSSIHKHHLVSYYLQD